MNKEQHIGIIHVSIARQIAEAVQASGEDRLPNTAVLEISPGFVNLDDVGTDLVLRLLRVNHLIRPIVDDGVTHFTYFGSNGNYPDKRPGKYSPELDALLSQYRYKREQLETVLAEVDELVVKLEAHARGL